MKGKIVQICAVIAILGLAGYCGRGESGDESTPALVLAAGVESNALGSPVALGGTAQAESTDPAGNPGSSPRQPADPTGNPGTGETNLPDPCPPGTYCGPSTSPGPVPNPLDVSTKPLPPDPPAPPEILRPTLPPPDDIQKPSFPPSTGTPGSVTPRPGTEGGSREKKCFLLLHGNSDNPLANGVITKYWGTGAPGDPDSWPMQDGKLSELLEAGADNHVVLLNYNSHFDWSPNMAKLAGYDEREYLAYEVAAFTVADQIRRVMKGESAHYSLDWKESGSCPHGSEYILVAHSMGGVVASYMLGNADPETALNYDEDFAYVAKHLSHVWTLSGATGHSMGANTVCGTGYKDNGNLNWLGTVVAWIFGKTCHPGTYSLQTGNSHINRADSKPVPFYMVGGSRHEIFPLKTSGNNLADTNDGIVDWGTSFACLRGTDPQSDDLWRTYGTTNVCLQPKNQFNDGSQAFMEAYGFIPCMGTWEDHATIKNERHHNDAGIRVVLGSGCFGDFRKPNDIYDPRMNAGTFIRCQKAILDESDAADCH